MSTNPKQPLVEKHIRGLGFKMEKETKKNCVVDLAFKEADLRNLLGLAHYSLPLNAVLLPEGCLAHLLSSNGGKCLITDLFKNGE